MNHKKLKTAFLVFVIALLSFSVFADWLKQTEGFLEQLTDSDATPSVLTDDEITNGLKEALTISVGKVLQQLGDVDGFNLDSIVHIPLPENYAHVDHLLSEVGLAYLGDDLELRMNRAAEHAVPKATTLFVDAITAMTLDYARSILSGDSDAATRYFQEKMTAKLIAEFQPMVEQSLSQTGVIKSYRKFIGEYEKIPFVPDLTMDLSQYVVEKAINGVFYYLAIEEAKIRRDPIARTTDLLKKVFSQSL